MKKIWFIVLFGMMSIRTYPQKIDSGRYFVIQPSVGYTMFALGDVRDFYDEVLAMYDQMGVHIPTQKDYPGNIIFGISTMYNIPSVARFGIGGQYSWTKAYSGYEDYAGLLEVNSKISMVTIEAIVEKDIQATKTANIFLGLRGGVPFVNTEYSNSVSLKDFPGQVEEVFLSGDGHGYTFEGYVGFNKSYKRFVFSVTAGYRISKVSEIDGTIIIPGEGSISGKLDLEHDLSGIVFNSRIGYRFGPFK
jgi:hypothetical protein